MDYSDMARLLYPALEPHILTNMPIYLPWAQRGLNPQAATGIWGDQGQPWAVQILAFYCSVYVVGPNSGINYWTVSLTDQGLGVIASFNTSAIAAGTWTRFAVTSGIAQPGSTNRINLVNLVTTGAPGAIYVVPAVALLITG